MRGDYGLSTLLYSFLRCETTVYLDISAVRIGNRMKKENIALKAEKQRKKHAEFAKTLPDSPGVYLMHDENAEILYIGKAGSLKKRVTSYFLESAQTKDEQMDLF